MDKMIDCPTELLPDNAKEGSILSIVIDEALANEKLQQNTDRMNRLFKD